MWLPDYLDLEALAALNSHAALKGRIHAKVLALSPFLHHFAAENIVAMKSKFQIFTPPAASRRLNNPGSIMRYNVSSPRLVNKDGCRCQDRSYVTTSISTPGSLLDVSSRLSYLSHCRRATPCFQLPLIFHIVFSIPSWPVWVSRDTLRWTMCCRGSTQPRSQEEMGLLHKAHRSTISLSSS